MSITGITWWSKGIFFWESRRVAWRNGYQINLYQQAWKKSRTSYRKNLSQLGKNVPLLPHDLKLTKPGLCNSIVPFHLDKSVERDLKIQCWLNHFCNRIPLCSDWAFDEPWFNFCPGTTGSQVILEKGTVKDTFRKFGNLIFNQYNISKLMPTLPSNSATLFLQVCALLSPQKNAYPHRHLRLDLVFPPRRCLGGPCLSPLWLRDLHRPCHRHLSRQLVIQSNLLCHHHHFSFVLLKTVTKLPRRLRVSTQICNVIWIVSRRRCINISGRSHLIS